MTTMEGKGAAKGKAAIPSHIFREYDIRGIAGTDLTPAVVEAIGRAYAHLLREAHPALPVGRRPRVAVAGDVRLSSPEVTSALMQGISSQELDIFYLGVCPTPLLYFSLFQLEVEGGIMVTGSHNPPEYNGLKICVGRETIHGPTIQRLREFATQSPPKSRRKKGIIENYPIIPHYLAWMNEHFQTLTSASATGPKADAARPIKVVVDAGNGTGGLVAPALLRSLGCRVTELYCEPDGSFPHHHPDPSLPENLTDLRGRLQAEEADLGIAYDGDADRIGVLDPQGEIIWGDRLMILFARDLLSPPPQPRIGPPVFIGEVKCSQVMYEEIERLGGVAIMGRTGHSPIKQLMREKHALLAGEMSGHLFFADRYFGYDDAIYASARLIEVLRRRESSITKLLADLPETYATPEIRLDCPDEQKFLLMEQLRQSLTSPSSPKPPLPLQKIITIDGLRLVFAGGWGLVRASNTQPALVLRFEASTPETLSAIRGWVEGMLRRMKIAN